MWKVLPRATFLDLLPPVSLSRAGWAFCDTLVGGQEMKASSSFQERMWGGVGVAVLPFLRLPW